MRGWVHLSPGSSVVGKTLDAEMLGTGVVTMLGLRVGLPPLLSASRPPRLPTLETTEDMRVSFLRYTPILVYTNLELEMIPTWHFNLYG